MLLAVPSAHNKSNEQLLSNSLTAKLCITTALCAVLLYDAGMIDPFFIAIVASGILAVLVGYVWYHPKVFGSAWMRMSNITPEMVEKGKRRMPLMAFVGLLASMLTAYVMSYIALAWGFYEWTGALQLGFWCWVGFVVPPMLGSVLWEQKPLRLYLINVLYWLVAFLAMAQIIVFTSSLAYVPYDGIESGIESYGLE